MYQLLLSIVTFGCLFSVLTLSLNLQYARGGMINFGMVAYFAAGAYAYAIFTQEPPRGLDQYLFGFGAPWWVGFLAAAFHPELSDDLRFHQYFLEVVCS